MSVLAQQPVMDLAGLIQWAANATPAQVKEALEAARRPRHLQVVSEAASPASVLQGGQSKPFPKPGPGLFPQQGMQKETATKPQRTSPQIVLQVGKPTAVPPGMLSLREKQQLMWKIDANEPLTEEEVRKINSSRDLQLQTAYNERLFAERNAVEQSDVQVVKPIKASHWRFAQQFADDAASLTKQEVRTLEKAGYLIKGDDGHTFSPDMASRLTVKETAVVTKTAPIEDVAKDTTVQVVEPIESAEDVIDPSEAERTAVELATRVADAARMNAAKNRVNPKGQARQAQQVKASIMDTFKTKGLDAAKAKAKKWGVV